jgi:hypothetical protein
MIDKKHEQKLDRVTIILILYLIERLNGVLGKTHLQKMLFLIELISFKRLKEKVTSIDFIKYTYGPFSKKVEEYIDYVKEKDLIEDRSFPLLSGEGTYHRYYQEKKYTVRNQLLSEIGPDKMVIINEVINSFGNISLKEILDVVYDIELVSAAEKNSPINIAMGFKNESEEKEEVDIF